MCATNRTLLTTIVSDDDLGQDKERVRGMNRSCPSTPMKGRIARQNILKRNFQA